MMCRETLDELMEFVRHYHRALRSSGVDARFERMMSAVPAAASTGPDPVSGTEGIELEYSPPGGQFNGEMLWAAATEAPGRQPLRFCSADDAYMLREIPDPAASRTLFDLTDSRGTRIGDVEVVIDGVSCRTDSGGTLDTGKSGIELTKGSRIILRTNRPA